MFSAPRLVMALLSCVLIAYAIPPQINYQGYLTAADGTPLDTTVDITFRIYQDYWGGTPVWDEIHTTTVINGYFEVMLGQADPLSSSLFDDGSMYLGITVGNDTEMSPLTPFASVPYSYRVGTVDSASGGTISGDVNIVGKGTIGTGHVNSGLCAFVAGASNEASGDYSTVSGGRYHSALGDYGSVGGGWYNQANGGWATVGGGEMNIATGYVATIPGGSNNWVSGAYSFAAGYNATVNGNNSFGLGTNILCNADSAFVWSDGSGTVTSIGMSRSFNVKASRGTRIWTSSDISSGVTIGAGGNAWVAVCDSTKKRNIRALDTQDILSRVSSLPLKRWEYKSEEQGIEHVGPMAQDFWKAFHLGEDSLGISTIDPDGVALAAIQELAKRCDQLEQQNITLQRQIQSLLAKDEQTQNQER